MENESDKISTQWLQVLDELPHNSFTIKFCYQPITYGNAILCESTALAVINKCENLDDADLIKYFARISVDLPSKYIQPHRILASVDSSVLFRASSLPITKDDLLNIIGESEHTEGEKQTPTYFRIFDEAKRFLAAKNLPELGTPLLNK